MNKKLFIYFILSISFLFILSPISIQAEEEHWARPQVEKLLNNYNVKNVFKNKKYDEPISIKDFKYIIREIIDKDYNDNPDNITREAIISEFVKIWAVQKGQSLANIPEINMFIYSDRTKIDKKNKKNIVLAYRKGIAKGRAPGVFAPNKEITYGELAVLLLNTKRAIEAQTFNDKKEIMQSEKAKEFIEKRAEKVIKAIASKDFETISEYVHPDKGVRFTPYTYVSIKNDIVLGKEKVDDFFQDDNIYLWGNYDGSGEPIRLTLGEYYQEFIYSKDFKQAEEVGYNEVLSQGNMLENQFEVYRNPIIVEYYLPGEEEKYSGMDWQSLRLVFECYEREWMLTGLIHNEWTI